MGEIKLPFPHKGQQIVRQQAKRFNWLAAGRRWRKTTLALAISIESAVARQSIIWGAPVFDQVRVAWGEAKHAAAGAAEFNLSRMEAVFPSGGSILFRSLDDPSNVRGHTADGVVIDECGFVKAEAWHEVLRPMLMDTGGWAWLIGTPHGRNWYWQEHVRACGANDAKAWQVPTLGVAVVDGSVVRRPHPLENPTIAFGEIAKLYQTMTAQAFEQEILAAFVDSSGGVFRKVTDAATAERQDKAIDGHDYAVGVDWGKSNDFTVLAVIDLTQRALVAIDRFNQIDYTVQVGRLQALCERFKPLTVIAESNSMGEPLIEQLKRLNLPVQPFTTTNATKTAAIDALALAFERSDLTIVNDTTLVAELQAYEMDRLPSGLLRYSAPDGMHDDTVMALAMGWQAAAHTLTGRLFL